MVRVDKKLLFLLFSMSVLSLSLSYALYQYVSLGHSYARMVVR